MSLCADNFPLFYGLHSLVSVLHITTDLRNGHTGVLSVPDLQGIILCVKRHLSQQPRWPMLCFVSSEPPYPLDLYEPLQQESVLVCLL